jgi:hypothetical protein
MHFGEAIMKYKGNAAGPIDFAPEDKSFESTGVIKPSIPCG